MAPNHREISPFLKLIRDFLLGRKHVTNNRYADTISARIQRPPDIPEGSPTRLFGNQYYLRDPRRQVKPPIDLVEQKKREVAAAKAAEAAKAAAKAAPKDTKPGAAAGPAPKGGTGTAPAPAPAPAKASAPAPAPAPTAADPTKTDQSSQPHTANIEPDKDGKPKGKSALPAPGKLYNWD
ncbi:NADH dehydrogenase [ubiquinone] 1 alpha subcomplex subunit 7 [Drosophila hydei]|uniref:NADH dehydrogenase [ubiquinone] 1 alpha subcomplex subunit 7 n=1 Tax=Drosophila hydei TaxID=7224 RepID=A0A6J1LPY7_DROHY|nr:NADH dehydrogenase [ubiquinone] 1 alpha subcomplex subunit 7 [Drosophila hydei]